MVYCINCDEYCNYKVRDEVDTYQFGDVSFPVRVKVSYCERCGCEVWNEELERLNFNLIMEAKKGIGDYK